MTPFATGIAGRYTKIYFAMSTWNPYEVMQMSTVVTMGGEPLDPHAYAEDASAPNERRYARIAVLQTKLAADRQIV